MILISNHVMTRRLAMSAMITMSLNLLSSLSLVAVHITGGTPRRGGLPISTRPATEARRLMLDSLKTSGPCASTLDGRAPSCILSLDSFSGRSQNSNMAVRRSVQNNGAIPVSITYVYIYIALSVAGGRSTDEFRTIARLSYRLQTHLDFQYCAAARVG